MGEDLQVVQMNSLAHARANIGLKEKILIYEDRINSI